MLSLAILIFFSLCMVFATLSDITTMKIPNKLILALLVGFVLMAPFSGLELADLGKHLAVAVAVLVVGFVAFSFRLLGAGDVKLLAATSLWLGPSATMPYLIYMGILGGAAIVILLLWRNFPLPIFLLKVDWITRLHQPKADMPYGVALGPAALLVFAASPIGEFAIQGMSELV